MRLHTLMRFYAAVLATLLVGPFAVAASAQSGSPPKPGCTGLNFTDVTGDSEREETDLLDGFFTTSGGAVMYNIRLASLPEGKTPGLINHVRYYVFYKVGGESSSVVAIVGAGGGARFEHTREGDFSRESSGAVYLGTPATVSFKLPGVAPSAPVSVGRIQADPGTDLPTDDTATGSTQAAACPPPTMPAQEEPAPPPTSGTSAPPEPAPPEPAPPSPAPTGSPSTASSLPTESRISFTARRLRDNRLRISGRVRGKRVRRVVIKGNGRTLARLTVRAGRFKVVLRGVPRGVRIRVLPSAA